MQRGLIPVTTASDRAYATIREMILSGKLAPGAQIIESSLAEECGVSRTPIRDALRRLEAELMVRRTDHQRSFVSEWSLDDMADAFELRAILEGHAAKRAAERMTDAVLTKLTQCNLGLRSAIQQTPPDIEGFLDGNREFHSTILEAAGSNRLAALLGSLIEQPVVWLTAQQYGPEAFECSYSEHEDLLAAFERRDGHWAEAIMQGHIRRAYHSYSDAHKGIAPHQVAAQ
jgi:DNA-binding GntR family transcriptional regulator